MSKRKGSLRLNLQLPRELIPQLTELTRQLQGLMDGALSLSRGLAAQQYTEQPVERGENTGFSPETFQRLHAPADEPFAGTLPDDPTAPAVTDPSEDPRDAVTVQRDMPSIPSDALYFEASADKADGKAAVQRDYFGSGGSPLPDMTPRWRSSAPEELAMEGAAPLTAEAVSRAFQEDDRRYDSGFPLY